MTAAVLADALPMHVLADVTNPIAAPSIEYGALLPLVIVFGAACAGVLVEAFVARPNRFSLQLPLTMAGLGGALVAVVWYAAKGATAHKVVARAPSRSTARLCSCRRPCSCWPSAGSS